MSGITSTPPRFLSSSGKSSTITHLAIAIIAIIFGLVLTRLIGLPAKWLTFLIVSFIILVLIIVAGNIRSCFLVILIISIPLGFDYHFVVRENYIGVSDGISIDLMDICLAILFAHYFFSAFFTNLHIKQSVSKVTYLIQLFFLASCLSIFNSTDRALTIYGVIEYCKAFLLYALITHNVKNRRDFELVILVLQFSLLIQATACILESALGTNFTLMLQQVQPDSISDAFRPTGLIGSPNHAGGYMAALIPLAAVQLFSSESKIHKTFSFIAALAGLAAVLLTLSRGAWLALAFGSLPLLCLLLRHRLIRLAHVILGSFLLLCILIPFGQNILSRLYLDAENVVSRYYLLKTSTSMIKDHPFIGIGLNTYSIQMFDYVPSQHATDWMYLVHNKFMLVWSETGSSALLFFILIVLFSYHSLFKTLRSQITYIRNYSIAFVSSLSVIIMHMCWEAYESGPIILNFWVLVALIVAVQKYNYNFTNHPYLD